MKILKGKTYFARRAGGQRRKVLAIRPFEGIVYYENLCTGTPANCTLAQFEDWMRDKPERRHRDPFTRVCKHCGHRKLIVHMVQYEASSKVMLWKCKEKCHAN
jgi:hypothetical protein